MICCDGEGRLNEKVHHAAKQVIFLVEGEEQRKSICINPGTQAKGQGGGTFAELKYHGSPDKMNASITIGIQILDLNSVRDCPKLEMAQSWSTRSELKIQHTECSIKWNNSGFWKLVLIEDFRMLLN
ncbi:hypothetical protein Peur_005089 [Populus x canadensis]